MVCKRRGSDYGSVIFCGSDLGPVYMGGGFYIERGSELKSDIFRGPDLGSVYKRGNCFRSSGKPFLC